MVKGCRTLCAAVFFTKFAYKRRNPAIGGCEWLHRAKLCCERNFIRYTYNGGSAQNVRDPVLF